MAVTPAMATEHWVGDDQGWKLNFDYKAWAESKEFHFSSNRGFTMCSNAEPLNSGNDVIELKSPGKRWYFCGAKYHCQLGMKVAINVLPEVGSPSTAPSGSPASSAASRIFGPSKFVASIVFPFSTFLMIIA
ncbi:PREDICTED: mavicyanin-like [Nicotiana attenuata]|uniref:mavicyanin-like n=1 Tax=Nicotiana attenuata TaxID=49451 RepID=UPI000905088F|nr:PREDICTED: mavicyanin-like [Nicotiana attenuata]